MIEWYTSTLAHYALVAVAIGLLMVAAHRGLRAIGVGREAATGLAFILPWALGFLIWNLFPVATSLYLSLTDFDVLQPPTWVGLANYERLFTADPKFWPSFQLTMAYSLLSVPLGLVGSIVAATLLNQGVRGVGLWRTLYYLPAILPAFIAALLWRFLLVPTENGLINAVTKPIWSLFSDTPPGWFLDKDMVLWGFVLMSFWGIFGANTVIVLAGLKNIPRDLYEAADVDGAATWSRFRNITLPMLSPTIFFLLVMGAIAAVQIFDQPLFVNVPSDAAQFLNVYLYTQGFKFAQMGYASAIAWVILVVILLLTLLIFRSSSAWVYYDAEVKDK